MKRTFKLSRVFKTALVLVSLVLGACSMSAHKAEIVNLENEKWKITALATYQDDSGWLVKGKLSSPNIFGLPEGQILISIVEEEGAVIERKKVNYQKLTAKAGHDRRHQYGRAVFLAHFKSIPQNAIVEAEFKTVNSIQKKGS